MPCPYLLLRVFVYCKKTFVGTQQAIGQPKMISRLTLGLDEQSPQFHSYFLIVHVYAPSCRRVLTGRGY